jgi:hypothetical protein
LTNVEDIVNIRTNERRENEIWLSESGVVSLAVIGPLIELPTAIIPVNAILFFTRNILTKTIKANKCIANTLIILNSGLFR